MRTVQAVFDDMVANQREFERIAADRATAERMIDDGVKRLREATGKSGELREELERIIRYTATRAEVPA